MLLNGAGAWASIDSKTIIELEKLQTLFLSSLFAVPFSTPRPSLAWDTGSLLMENRVLLQKLNLAFHIKSLEQETLAKKVLEEQLKNEWPGLEKYVRDICKDNDLPDILWDDDDVDMTKKMWKKLVKEAIVKKKKKS